MNVKTTASRVKLLALSSLMGIGVLGAVPASAAPKKAAVRGRVHPVRTAQVPQSRWVNDFDRDGVPNGRDRDIDGDGILNGRDRNDYTPLRKKNDLDGDGVRNGRDRDRDGDGVRNGRDDHPNNVRRA